MSKNIGRENLEMVNGVRIGVVSLLLGRAIYTDVLRGKIENVVIFLGLVCGMLCAYGTDGGRGMIAAGKAAGVMLLSMYILYVIKGLGAGDIKLLMVMVTFLPGRGVDLVIGSFLAGAAIALLRMGIRLIQKRSVYVRGETIPFSVPVAISCLVCLVQEVMG